MRTLRRAYVWRPAAVDRSVSTLTAAAQEAVWIDIRILAEPVYRPVLIEHLKSATAEMRDVEVEPRREMARELSILPRQQAVTAVRGRSMRKDHLICVVPSAVLPMYIAEPENGILDSIETISAPTDIARTRPYVSHGVSGRERSFG